MLGFDHWIWLVPVFWIGACIGSFLNVVIYRVPLGMSVNEPKRSFCPQCCAPISMVRNIPLASWLLLRGKCANCRAPIPFRYFGVELLTALMVTAAWRVFPPVVFLPLAAGIALWIAITFIDAEHLIIPTGLTWGGTAAGLAGSIVWPHLPRLAGGWERAAPWIPGAGWAAGLMHSAIGWAAGFFGLWAVVELGKLAFGRKAMTFSDPARWQLREPENDTDPLLFEIGDETIAWWDIFYRKTDRLLVDCRAILVDGSEVPAGNLVICEEAIELPDGTVKQLADLKSLSGTAVSAVIPREAMGFGDVHLMGMIGAFFGWSGVLFALFASSFYAIVLAIFARIGFGRQLPFGPFLVMGALTWAFGGWKLWAWYFEFLRLPDF